MVYFFPSIVVLCKVFWFGCTDFTEMFIVFICTVGFEIKEGREIERENAREFCTSVNKDVLFLSVLFPPKANKG